MKNFKLLLTRPLQALPTSLVIFILIIALLGFADSAYLTIEHYKGVIPPCSVVSGCETVLTSAYSVIAGIPVSLLGSIYYFLILVGVFAYLEGKHEKMLRWALLLTLLGFIMTLGLVYIMAFVLYAWCLYCLISVVTSTALFVTACYIFTKYKSENENI